jgi:FkbM family methyltransferase
MWSKGDDDVTSAVYWGGWAGHEKETAGLFWEVARTARVVLDIGAHVGYFSLLAGLANSSAKVHSFEPLPLVHERLRYNVSLNNLENVSCHELAMGERPGRERFYHLPDCIPSSSSLSRTFMEPIVGDRTLVASQVEVTSVDEFVARHALTGVDLVKLDTEGTEDSVIAGMVRTIAENRPTFFCEVLPGGPARAIEDILASFDYRFYLLSDAGARPCVHIEPHHKWRNHLFRPAEPPPDQSAGDSRREETDDADA